MQEGQSQRVSLQAGQGGMTVPRLYFALLHRRTTGVLTFSQPHPEAGARRVWLRGGMPVFTDWVSSPDVLGEILLARRWVSHAAFESALMTLARDGGLLGQILRRAGALDSATLAEALRTQCARKLVHTFGLDGGEAEIVAVDHEKGRGDDLTGQVNVLGLMLHGVAAHYSEATIRTEMGELLDGTLMANPSLERYRAQFGFRPEDSMVLEFLTKGGQLSRLLTPGIDRRRAFAIIYTVWVAQMLRTGQEATMGLREIATAPAPPPPPRLESPRPTPIATAKPTPPPPPAPVTGEGSLVVALEEFEGRVRSGADPFALMGLGIEAERGEIRSAWASLSRRFHPDALSGPQHAVLHDRVERVFASLSEAYATLSDKAARSSLIERLRSGANPNAQEDTAAEIRNALEAEMIGREADKLLKAGSFARAIERFERAAALSPLDGEIAAALSWSRFLGGDKTAASAQIALTDLARILAEQPRCARAHYTKGLLLLHLGRKNEAKLAFVTAHEIDPRLTDAERQIRALRASDGTATPSPEPPKKRGLKDLFRR